MIGIADNPMKQCKGMLCSGKQAFVGGGGGGGKGGRGEEVGGGRRGQ